MKTTCLFLALTTISALADSSGYLNFVRQNQQGTGVVWDMPVASDGVSPAALLMEDGGTLFQLWTVDKNNAKDYLLDQKLVGAYLPKADIKIITGDSYTGATRTRVDKPFSVQITLSDLLSGTGLPEAATKVIAEQHIQNYPAGSTTLDPVKVMANVPSASTVISNNGLTPYNFNASSLKAADPTKAMGEEFFVVHALSDGSFSQTQIASARVQVWPVAYGKISGLTPGALYRTLLPTVQLDLNDLYPRSDTAFMLYSGTGISGTGTLVKAYPMDRDTINSLKMEATELDSKITKDGTYTVALMSTTVYGTELLADPITFSVKRSISVNAMQVNYAEK